MKTQLNVIHSIKPHVVDLKKEKNRTLLILSLFISIPLCALLFLGLWRHALLSKTCCSACRILNQQASFLATHTAPLSSNILYGQEMMTPRSRIYIIGYSKTGTTSLWKWFGDAGLTSRHWQYGELYSSIKSREQPLFQVWPNTTVFSNLISIEGIHELNINDIIWLRSSDPNSTIVYTHLSTDTWLENIKRRPSLLLVHLFNGDCHSLTSCLNFMKKNYQKFHNDVMHHFQGLKNDASFISLDIGHPQVLIQAMKKRYPLLSNQIPRVHQQDPFKRLSQVCINSCF